MNHMFKQILQGDFYSERDFTAKMPRDFLLVQRFFGKLLEKRYDMLSRGQRVLSNRSLEQAGTMGSMLF